MRSISIYLSVRLYVRNFFKYIFKCEVENFHPVRMSACMYVRVFVRPKRRSSCSKRTHSPDWRKWYTECLSSVLGARELVHVLDCPIKCPYLNLYLNIKYQWSDFQFKTWQRWQKRYESRLPSDSYILCRMQFSLVHFSS